MGNSKKSEKHHRKRSSSSSSSSSDTEERKKYHKKQRETSNEVKARSSKWDSPDADCSSNRRQKEINQEAFRDERSTASGSTKRRHGEVYDKQFKKEKDDSTRKYPERSGSPRSEFKDSKKRRDDNHAEEEYHRRSRDGQNYGRRYRDDRRNVRNEQECIREDRHESNLQRSHNRNRSSNRRFPRQVDDDKKYDWGKRDDRPSNQDNLQVEKEKPNFGLSGKLTEDTNKVNGVIIKYAEPPEARKPKRRWRLYPFKGEQALPTMYIHRQSCYLIGRDHKVCDLRVDHPSCSKQHAALQYRLVPFEREDGTIGKRVRLYLIDLESSNGTYVNNNRIEARKYVELLEKDVVKFGFSSREYVLLHENSQEETLDDDVTLEQEATIKTEPVN
ncbi:uncharacterized protein LOC129789399 [Lutzomyia longipalpis]|uniref:uncharacterized protein LOC129789399 n=1 Tax=Lutzomyia longipalpis TaxID=7200 RepID=UPI002483DE71|nr:uncharacterized protein LOC129789399 [Lutzomyia longipalpis]